MGGWKDQLAAIVSRKGAEERAQADAIGDARRRVAAWVASTARPALVEFAAELEAHGRHTFVSASDAGATIEVRRDGRLEMRYRIEARFHGDGHHLVAKVASVSRGQMLNGESPVTSGGGDTVDAVGRDEVLASLLRQYELNLSG